ncbi:MAG: LLM class flavin-dependent oxidoreductase [Gammaproteobacteria bacterium]|nr:LLM class flavin-dependent oxidoreductase [Gammaproteobacteria bacterium]
MKFSILHLPTFYLDAHGSEARFYQNILAQCDRAEVHGFHSAWFAEHHFHNYGGHIPSVPVLASAVAQRTKNIRLGSGICLIPLQDPVRVAEQYAMLDCLSGGRLEFGIGRGFQKMEYDAFERDMGDSRALFEEAHDIIIKAWTEKEFSYSGRFRTLRNIEVIPKPVQKLPPIYVACIFTEESFEWTGKMGYNLMTVPYASPDPKFIVDRIEHFRAARKAVGHAGAGEVLGVYHFYCGETAEQAQVDTRGPMMRYVDAVIASNKEAAYSGEYKMYKALPQAFAGFTFESLYPKRVIFGDPEQCAERIREITAMGVTNISLLVDFGGLAPAKILASMDRFAQHVMPKFR